MEKEHGSGTATSFHRRQFKQSIANDDEEEPSVICICGRTASLKTSHTSQNPNRKFYGCPRWNPGKGDKGCGFFEWHDVRVAIEKDRKRMAIVLNSLKMENLSLKEENEALHEDNTKLQGSIAHLLQRTGDSENDRSQDLHYYTPSKVQWDRVESRLKRLEISHAKE